MTAPDMHNVFSSVGITHDVLRQGFGGRIRGMELLGQLIFRIMRETHLELVEGVEEHRYQTSHFGIRTFDRAKVQVDKLVGPGAELPL